MPRLQCSGVEVGDQHGPAPSIVCPWPCYATVAFVLISYGLTTVSNYDLTDDIVVVFWPHGFYVELWR